MKEEKRRVVITGVGMISPIGKNVKESWNNLIQKKSGIKKITLFNPEGFSCQIAAQVVNEPNLTDKKISRGTYFGLVAAQEAVADAKLSDQIEAKKNMAVFIGNSGSRTSLENFESIFKKKNKTNLQLEDLNNDNEFDRNRYSAAAEVIAKEVGVTGGCYSITTACASGTQAIGMAYRKIKDGANNMILAGGCDAMISEIDLIGFCMLGAVTSQYNNNPEKASRPFNKDRSGFVLGEGAGMLILEEYEHAVQRKAKIYAEVVGFGNTISGYSILDTPPDGEALASAMAQALKEAKINKEDIGYINAHGTSTRDNDSSEAAAIRNIFKEYTDKVPVSSTKSATGHLISGAGAIESIFTIMALVSQTLPPTLNLEDIDGKCQLCHIDNATSTNMLYAMSNSLGFGGSNASIIFRRN